MANLKPTPASDDRIRRLKLKYKCASTKTHRGIKAEPALLTLCQAEPNDPPMFVMKPIKSGGELGAKCELKRLFA
jgi:hypothetical protein